MRRLRLGLGALGALLFCAACQPCEAQVSVPVPKGSKAIRRYVYTPPSYQPIPPPYPYGYGYFAGRLDQPPVGFGSPYYNGYNDPYYGFYGPGVREFLEFGGADFYGW